MGDDFEGETECIEITAEGTLDFPRQGCHPVPKEEYTPAGDLGHSLAPKFLQLVHELNKTCCESNETLRFGICGICGMTLAKSTFTSAPTEAIKKLR